MAKMEMLFKDGRAKESLELAKLEADEWERCSYNHYKVEWADTIEEEEEA